jgi:hypothetical protein
MAKFGEFQMADFIKDPNEVLDYSFDWSDWLSESEEINTSTWINPDSITINTSAKTATSSVVWVSGGTAGKTYRLTNRIVTTNNPTRTEDRTLTIEVQER